MVLLCSLPKTILQVIVEGGRRRGREQKKQLKKWLENVKDWTGLRLNELLAIVRLTADESIYSPQRPMNE